jgi:hypothetical protein
MLISRTFDARFLHFVRYSKDTEHWTKTRRKLRYLDLLIKSAWSPRGTVMNGREYQASIWNNVKSTLGTNRIGLTAILESSSAPILHSPSSGIDTNLRIVFHGLRVALYTSKLRSCSKLSRQLLHVSRTIRSDLTITVNWILNQGSVQ